MLTALAEIRPADTNGAGHATGSHGTDDKPSHAETSDHLEGKALREIFGVLPEPTRDPFASLADRLKATLNLYRFTADGSSILDWASVQTRLADPLSRFTRAELEQEFGRFSHERDTHLRSLIRDAQRSRSDEALALLRDPPASAKRAVTRFNGAR